MKVAILGCGPTGLLAAEAASRMGADAIMVFSIKRKSKMYGAQYLHRPIPGFKLPTRMINHSMEGELLDYRHRVYGPNADGEIWKNTSANAVVGDFPGQDIRALYDELWERYSYLIEDAHVDHALVSLLVSEGWVVLSTIPRNQMCYALKAHEFRSTPLIAAGDAPDLGIRIPIPDFGITGDFVKYSGAPENSWCRISNVFDFVTIEWPHDANFQEIKEEYLTAAPWFKPMATNCDCWKCTGRVYFLGRYGAWHKGTLAHDAFFEAMKVLGHERERV